MRRAGRPGAARRLGRPRPAGGARRHAPGGRRARGRAGRARTRRAEGRHRRHRLGADLLRARPHDDRAGPGALLRRHGAAEERAGHPHAVVHPDGGHLDPVGALGLQPRVRARHRRHRRQPQVDRPVGRRRGAERRLRGDDPAPGLHGLPAHVRHHHARADHGHVRRADEVLGLPPLLAPVGHADLRPARALGLGRRRVAPRAGRPRLRRGHGRPHLLGRLRPRRRAS